MIVGKFSRQIYFVTTQFYQRYLQYTEVDYHGET